MKRKFFGCFLAVAVFAMSLVGGVFVSAAADTYDSADLCFLDAVEPDNLQDLSYERTRLYDEQLQPSGWQYNFSYDGGDGYVLMAPITLGETTIFEMEELRYNQVSPFDSCTGYPVYVTFNLYLDYHDGAFYDLVEDVALTEEQVNESALNGFGFRNTGSSSYEHIEEISFDHKETITYSMNGEVPNYVGTLGANNCAVTSGTILIGFYDRYHEDLVPNCKNYVQIGQAIIYTGGGIEIEEVMHELYDRMGTNVGQSGTTFSGFQSGMTSFCADRGFTYQSTSVLSYGSLNFEAYKQSVENYKPVALFLSTYSYMDYIGQGENKDTVESTRYNSSHVVIGCGYRRDTYYNASGNVITTRTYLRAASTSAIQGMTYVNINGFGQIDKAISVNIE